MGIGPGDASLLSLRALEAITKCQAIVGYATYIKLLGNLAADKEIISTGMAGEVERAKLAISEALTGKQVCLISSGDPGVYGMAGLVLELLNPEEAAKIAIEIVPGITAATSCASFLGAPLMHDFVVISLSDLLTDKKKIKKRIKLAAQADFVIVLYNPKSKKRVKPLVAAGQILLEHKSPNTPVGIVRNAERENEEVIITTLKNMLSVKKIDMVTTIIVGNSQSYIKGEYMITPRGYNLKAKR